MPEFGINIELDIDAGAGRDLSAIAYDWFDEVSQALLAEPRAFLERGGPAPAAPQFVDPASWNPTGAPVTLRGSLSTTSGRAKAYDATAMDWLRKHLAAEPERVDLRFALFAGSGPEAPNVWYPSVYAHRPEESPQWLRIGAYVRESLFLNPQHAAEAQHLWLGILRTFADRVDPGFGQIEYGFDTEGTTALESSFSADVPLEERDPEYTVAQSREYLRGYSWLTVVPAELTQVLGGPEALQRTEAFVQVAPLRGGGAWLLATENYRDYGPHQVAQVFGALAPVLRPGQPHHLDDPYGGPPARLVAQNAARPTKD